MSTRCAIGLFPSEDHDEWEGRYCHSDGYPSGVGQWLIKEYQRAYKDNLGAMVEMLMHEPVGWSAIDRRDLTLKAEWWDESYQPGKWKSIDEWDVWYFSARPRPPRAYSCRGETADTPEGFIIARPSDDDGDAVWAYIFDLRQYTMTIYRRTGGGWEVRATIGVNDENNIDWEALDRG